VRGLRQSPVAGRGGARVPLRLRPGRYGARWPCRRRWRGKKAD